jgi:hypothetical protein
VRERAVDVDHGGRLEGERTRADDAFDDSRLRNDRGEQQSGERENQYQSFHDLVLSLSRSTTW